MDYKTVSYRLRVTTDEKIKRLSRVLTAKKEELVTQGQIVTMAIAALERELAAVPPAPEDEIRPEVRAAARDAGVDLT